MTKQEVGSLAREAQPRLQLSEQLFASIELLLQQAEAGFTVHKYNLEKVQNVCLTWNQISMQI